MTAQDSILGLERWFSGLKTVTVLDLEIFKLLEINKSGKTMD